MQNAIPLTGANSVADAAKSTVEAAPDGSSEISSLSSIPDLSTSASDLRTVIDELNDKVKVLIESSTSDFMDTIQPALTSARASVGESVNTIESLASDSINPAITNVQSTFNMIESFEQQRYLITLTLEVLE